VVAAIVERKSLAVVAAAGAGIALGSVAGAQPKPAIGLLAGALVATLALRAPTASVVSLIFLTAIVPYAIANRFGVGGGVDSPGLLLSDVLLFLGLGMAALALQQRPLGRPELVAIALVSLFLGVASLQLLHGLWLGRSTSQAGAELRELLGFGTCLIALPILHHPQARKRLLVSLLALAITLGLWGIVQWVGNFSFGGDVGVRQGVRLTTAGTGQLQGGLFGFPVAVVACYAILLGGAMRSTLARVGLAAAIFLNALSLFLTFERTFWIATVAGLLAVTLRANTVQRIKGLLLIPLLLVVLLATISVVAPTQLTTARERVLSLKQTGGTADRYRVEESHYVRGAISQHPIIGSGLGATIFWGRPWAGVPPKSYAYSHNSYLWLAWKIGVPGAALLVILFGVAILLPGPPREDALAKSIRGGAQASLLTLLLASVTFPNFSALSITAVMGVLVALSVAPLAAQRDA
jgi:O-antigen ligase